METKNNIDQPKSTPFILFYRIQETIQNKFICTVVVSSSAVMCLFFCRIVGSTRALTFLFNTMTPKPVRDFFLYSFPITDLKAAYDIISEFTHENDLQLQLKHLLFVTFNIQVGLGYLGIDFPRSGQVRNNEVVRMGKH